MADKKGLDFTIRTNVVGDAAIKKLGDNITKLKAAAIGYGVAQAKQTTAVITGTQKVNVQVSKTQSIYTKLKTVAVTGMAQMTAAKQKLVVKAGQLAVALERSQKSMSFGQQLIAAKQAVFALAGLTYGVVSAVRAFMDFEHRLSEVNTLLGLNAEAAAKLGDEIITLSRKLPQTAAELTAAEYDIISAGVKLKDSTRVLELSAKAAVAGVTDTKTAVLAGVGAVNAYGKNMGELSRVYDVLFTTVKAGVTTFPELAENMGQVLPTARAAGVSLEEVSAAMAEMTKAGIRTPIAATALRGALVALSSPTEEAKKEMEALGVTWKGLIPTLEQIAEKNLDIERFTNIIPDVRARTGLLSLTQNLDGLKNTLDSMRDSTGAMQEAYDIMAESPANQVKILGNEITALKIAFGGLVAEGLVPTVKRLREFAAVIRELPASTKAVIGVLSLGASFSVAWALGLGKVVIAVIGLAAPLLKLIKGLSDLAKLEASITALMGGMSVAVKVLAGGIAALGVAIVAYTVYKFMEAANAAKKLEQQLNNLRQQVKAVKNEFDGFKDARMPKDFIGKTPEEVRTLREELMKARAYWTALHAELESAAQQTNVFGMMTDDAKAAKNELVGVAQRLREVNSDIARLRTGQEEGSIANIPKVALPDISVVKGYIDDERRLLADRIEAIQGIAVEEQEIGEGTAQAIFEARATAAERINEIVATGLEFALAAYGAESEEFKAMMAEATTAQQDFETLRNEALAKYETAVKKLKGIEQDWAAFIKGLNDDIEEIDQANFIDEEKREADRLKAEELRYAAREEAEKGTEESYRNSMEMLQESAELEKQNAIELKDTNGEILETKEKAQKIAREGLEETIQAAEDIKEAHLAAQRKMAEEQQANFERTKEGADSIQQKLVDINKEAEKLAEKKELKVELTPTYERLLEQFKKLTAPETKTITIQTIEAHATGGLAGSRFTRKRGRIPGDGTKDDVPALLMRGEYVIKKDAVKYFGQSFLDGINNMIYTPGVLPKFAIGGYVNLPLDRKIERAEATIKELQDRLLTVTTFEPGIADRAAALIPQGINFEGINPRNPDDAMKTLINASSTLSRFRVTTNEMLAKGVTSAIGLGNFDVAEILKTERDAIKSLVKDLYDSIKEIALDLRELMIDAQSEEIQLRFELKNDISGIKGELNTTVREERDKQEKIETNMSIMKLRNEEEFKRTGLSLKDVLEYFAGKGKPEQLDILTAPDRIPMEKEYTIKESANYTNFYYRGTLVGYIKKHLGEEVERIGYVPKGTRSGNKITETVYGNFYNPAYAEVGADEIGASKRTVKQAQIQAKSDIKDKQKEFAYARSDLDDQRIWGASIARENAIPVMTNYGSELVLLTQQLKNETLTAEFELKEDIQKAQDDLQDLLDQYEMERLAWLEEQKKLHTDRQQETSTKYFASGGRVTGEPGRDRVPAMLTSGEYVLNTAAVNRAGLGFLDRLNSLRLPEWGGDIRGYAEGGIVSDNSMAGPQLGTINLRVGESTMPAQVDKKIARQFIRELKLAGMTI